MDRLEPDERRLLDAYVAARTPDGAAIARAFAATLRRVEHGPRQASHDRWSRAAMLVIAAAAIVLITWRGFAVFEKSRRDDTHEIAPSVIDRHLTEGDASPRAPTPTPTRAASDGAAAIAPVVPSSKPTEPARPEQRGTKRSRSTPSLAEELALLRAADAALDRGDAKKAIALLDRHAREYPRGQMIPERMLQKGIALCRLGKREASRATVEKLLRAYPTTPLRVRASAVCNGDEQR